VLLPVSLAARVHPYYCPTGALCCPDGCCNFGAGYTCCQVGWLSPQGPCCPPGYSCCPGLRLSAALPSRHHVRGGRLRVRRVAGRPAAVSLAKDFLPLSVACFQFMSLHSRSASRDRTDRRDDIVCSIFIRKLFCPSAPLRLDVIERCTKPAQRKRQSAPQNQSFSRPRAAGRRSRHYTF
jgi:hypothetical protein